MSPKSIAFLVVGMVLISSVFFIFHVTYPANPVTIKLNQPPKNITPPNVKIFQNQSINLPHLGLNQTSFTPSGNTSMILEGYAYNYSNQQPLANENLGIAVMQAFTMVKTDSQGYYRVQILASGQGTFAYKAFQYNTTLRDLYIGQNIASLWQNVSLGPQLKYSVSGLTLSHGNDIPSVGLQFKDFWGSYSLQSSNAASYSASIVDGNYQIVDYKQGFSPVPNPQTVNVSNSNLPNFDISLNSTSTALFYINGYVHNKLGDPVGGAKITIISPHSLNETVYSGPNGFYNISVAYYTNVLEVTATGYATQTPSVTVIKNITGYNITLDSQDPFQPSPYTGSIGSGYPAGMSNVASVVNYGNPLDLTITGNVILNQTGMPVPNQSFVVYTSVNGTYFLDEIQTNQSGGYTIALAYPGSFHFTITSTNFYNTYLNKSLQQSLSNIPIYVITSPSKVYSVTGHLGNGINNLSLGNATINITSPTGQILKTIHLNSTGNFSFKGLGGNYTLNITSPGFGSINYPLNLTGNTSMNLTLSPTTGIAPGSSQWNSTSGSGLPGVNGSTISSQLNGTQGPNGQPPGTTSGQPVTLELLLIDNSTSQTINNTPLALYIEVNGIILRVNDTTNGSGIALLPMSYGGTYSILPEMIQYIGKAQFINTTMAPVPIIFNMTPLKQYNLQINLSNPLRSYTGSSVPVSGLSGDGYFLPIVPYSVQPGSNYTVVAYSLPNGTYTFTYNDVNYVPASFNYSLNGSSLVETVVLRPYALFLSWNTATSWKYTLSGSGIAGTQSYSGSPGTSSEIYALVQGSFDYTAYIQSYTAGQKNFDLNSTHNVQYLTFDILQGTESVNNPWSYYSTSSEFTVSANLTASQTQYISQISINVSLTSNSTLTLASANNYGLVGTNTFNIANYFVSSANVQTGISIVSYGFKDLSALTQSNTVNLTISYYTTSLAG